MNSLLLGGCIEFSLRQEAAMVPLGGKRAETRWGRLSSPFLLLVFALLCCLVTQCRGSTFTEDCPAGCVCTRYGKDIELNCQASNHSEIPDWSKIAENITIM